MMGDFEKYYIEKDRQKLAIQVESRVVQYNIRVDVIQTLMQMMLVKADEQPPEDCDWIIQDNEKKVAWKMFEGIYPTAICLMPYITCNLVLAEKIEKDKLVYKALIYLRHIDLNDLLAQPSSTCDFDDLNAEPEEKIIRQPSLGSMKALCTEMVKIAKERFKVSSVEIRKLTHNLVD